MNQPKPPIPASDSNWNVFFDDLYADLFLTESEPGRSDQIAQNIISLLELESGDCVLDQCCGIGRLSIPLAERGIDIIGVDFIHQYIDRAREDASQRNVSCEFHCADAGVFTAPRLCDAAMNWFTSFGYSMNDGKNRALLHRAFESLKPGGRYVMERNNMDKSATESAPPFEVRRQTAEGDVVVTLAHQFDVPRRINTLSWTFHLPDGTCHQRNVRLRVYFADELKAMLEDAGFVDVRLLGSADGAPFEKHDSNRLLLLANKPG